MRMDGAFISRTVGEEVPPIHAVLHGQFTPASDPEMGAPSILSSIVLGFP